MDWEEAARRLEPRLDLSRISGSVAARLRSEALIYVACSGGADSVFALLLVRAFLGKCDRLAALRVLHFDHALRGEASAADADFVGSICESLCIPFLDAKARWPDVSGAVNEAKARDLRLAFFREATGSLDGDSAAVVTGHHADDIVETMLMRLSRGAGLQGLSAPHEVSDPGGGLVFLRPLLDWGRSEIHALLDEAGVPWREDETNASHGNYRARLRKQAIPEWEAAADRPLRPGVARSRRLLAEDAEALDSIAGLSWAQCWDEAASALRRGAVAVLPLAIQRRLLLRLPQGGHVSAAVVDEALAAIAAGKRLKLEVGVGLFFEFSRDWLRLREADTPQNAGGWTAFGLPVGTCAFLPDGARVSWARVALDEALREKLISGSNDDRRIVYLAEKGNSRGRLVVRTRLPGDAFKPLGKTSAKKLKNLFIERKVDREERDRLPVFVCEASGILWVPGLPPSADNKLGFRSETALRLTYDK